MTWGIVSLACLPAPPPGGEGGGARPLWTDRAQGLISILLNSSVHCPINNELLTVVSWTKQGVNLVYLILNFNFLTLSLNCLINNKMQLYQHCNYLHKARNEVQEEISTHKTKKKSTV